MSLKFNLIPSSRKEIMLVRAITGAYKRYMKYGEESCLYRGLELIDLLETEQKNVRKVDDKEDP